MSWKLVFNSENLGIGKTLGQIADIAENAGYEFFTFNEDVYFVSGGMQNNYLLYELWRIDERL